MWPWTPRRTRIRPVATQQERDSAVGLLSEELPEPLTVPFPPWPIPHKNGLHPEIFDVWQNRRLIGAVQSREELAALLPDNDALLARLKHLAQVATRTETAEEPAAAPATSQATEAAATEAAKATEAAHAETSVTAPEATPVAEEAAAPAEMDAEPEIQNKVQASPADDKPAKADAVAPEQEATATAEAADAEPTAAATADAPDAEADEPADTTPTHPAAKAAKGGNRRGRQRKH